MTCAATDSQLVFNVKRSLMKAVDQRITELFESQYHAERELNIPQRMISRLHTQQDERFSIVWLLLTAERLGVKVSIKVE